MSAYRPHRFLTDLERRELALLVHRAARLLPGPAARRMVELLGRLLADYQHERRRAVDLDKRLNQLSAVQEPPAPDEQPIPCVRVVA